MAFGVKWKETGEKSGRDSAGQQGPGRGRLAPGADGGGGAARRARRLHPPTRPQTGREGGGGGGGGGTEPSAIFPYSPKHTDTLSGHRLSREHNPALGRPARTERGPRGSPRPDRQTLREGLHTHPPPFTHIQLLAPERRVAPARLATHRTTQASSSQNRDTRRRDAEREANLGPGARPNLGASQARG